MPKDASIRSRLADELLVSSGSAMVKGRSVCGLGVHRAGESFMWFLPVSGAESLPRIGPGWQRIARSEFVAQAGPLDEQLVTGPGVHGHRYVIDVPSESRKPEGRESQA